MAEMQDVFEDEVSEIEAVEQQDQQAAATVQQQQTKQQEDDLPEEFKGLSVKELANIAKHARREMGRQANELGEVRKLADELLKSQLRPKQEIEQPNDVDFFENPQEAIRRAVDSNPKVIQAEQYAVHAQKELAKQQLARMHPDFGQLLQDPEFHQFVGGSKIRQQLLRNADSYDVDAADELFSTFKQLKSAKTQQVVQQTSETERVARTNAMRAASVDTGGTGESGRKIYRRADLIRLKMTDPARYDAMNDEILAAYAEGRVK